MLRFLHITLILSAVVCFRVCGQNITLTTVADITPILDESSGITYRAPNSLYTHNDSGGGNELFEIDTLGNWVRTIIIGNATNIDWEDITHDNSNNIYIGDFGNNDNDRTNLRILKIPDPHTFSNDTVNAEIISFLFPDQSQFPPFPPKRNFDAEAFVWFNDSLFIFTKNRTAPFNGYCKVYKVPDLPGNYNAQLCDSVLIGLTSQSENWVTAAALSEDKSQLALLNGSKIWLFSCFNNSSFFKGNRANILLNSMSQKEGICFKNNNKIFITDELFANTGGKLYQASLADYTTMPFVNINQDSIICDNCTLSVDSFSGNLFWSNGTFGPSMTPNYTGWHSVTAKTLNNCTFTDSVYVSWVQAVKQNANQALCMNARVVSPEKIKVNLSNISQSQYTLRLLNLSGKIVNVTYIEPTAPNQEIYIFAPAQNGLYFLELSGANTNIVCKVVIAN